MGGGAPMYPNKKIVQPLVRRKSQIGLSESKDRVTTAEL